MVVLYDLVEKHSVKDSRVDPFPPVTLGYPQEFRRVGSKTRVGAQGPRRVTFNQKTTGTILRSVPSSEPRG